MARPNIYQTWKEVDPQANVFRNERELAKTDKNFDKARKLLYRPKYMEFFMKLYQQGRVPTTHSIKPTNPPDASKRLFSFEELGFHKDERHRISKALSGVGLIKEIHRKESKTGSPAVLWEYSIEPLLPAINFLCFYGEVRQDTYKYIQELYKFYSIRTLITLPLQNIYNIMINQDFEDDDGKPTKFFDEEKLKANTSFIKEKEGRFAEYKTYHWLKHFMMLPVYFSMYAFVRAFNGIKRKGTNISLSSNQFVFPHGSGYKTFSIFDNWYKQYFKDNECKNLKEDLKDEFDKICKIGNIMTDVWFDRVLKIEELPEKPLILVVQPYDIPAKSK